MIRHDNCPKTGGIVLSSFYFQTDEQEVINFLLNTEIIPLCLRIMESGSELSKTVRHFDSLLSPSTKRLAGEPDNKEFMAIFLNLSAGFTIL